MGAADGCRKSWKQRRDQRKCVSLLEKLKREQRFAVSSGRYPAGCTTLLRLISSGMIFDFLAVVFSKEYTTLTEKGTVLHVLT